MAILSEYTVSHDLSICAFTSGRLNIASRGGKSKGIVTANNFELPALLARLEAAAVGMGIPTAQGELVAVCKALLEYRRRNSLNFQLEKLDDFLQKLGQAIAKAEQ